MKVLLDTCVWGGVKQVLARAGHDVIWAGDWEKDPGDDEILDIAYRESRVLITLDKDFGELAIVFGQPHSGIVRLVNMSTKQQGGGLCGGPRALRIQFNEGCIDNGRT